jgi:hypothetical protein
VPARVGCGSLAGTIRAAKGTHFWSAHQVIIAHAANFPELKEGDVAHNAPAGLPCGADYVIPQLYPQ